MKQRVLRAGFVVLTSALVLTTMAAAPSRKVALASVRRLCASKPSKWQRLQCREYHKSAPGDQYFGQMKMSYLGVENTFRDQAIRAGQYTTNSGIISSLHFADQSLQQWASRYPHDVELARAYFLAALAYKKVYTQPAQERAWHYMQMLVNRFPDTYFGRVVKKDLKVGFTENWFAAAKACPLPGALPVVAVPVPSPTPSPMPGRPKIHIIAPPCIVPPSPSPMPSASPIPSASATPAAAGLTSPAGKAVASPTPSPKP